MRAFEQLGWKGLLGLAWPLIIANSFWNLQLTIDRVFLGQYSTDALAAAMAVMGVFWTPMALLQQTAAYTITFTAQYLGSEQSDRVGPAVWQSLYVSVIGGTLLLFLIPFAPAFFAMVGHSPAVQQLESVYMQALLWSALPTAIVAGISGFFTGIDRTRTVMWINGVGLISNVILDYLLIFGNLGFPRLGMLGAGYATAGANVVAAGFAAYQFFNHSNELHYHARSGWRWDGALMKRFLKFGIPSGMQWALEGLAFTVFLIIVGRMENGDAALAASSIAVTILMLAILPPMGIAQAASAKVGQYLGQNDPDRAETVVWTATKLSAVFIGVMAVSFLLIPDFYASWFESKSDPTKWGQTAELVPYLLIFVAIFAPMDTFNVQLSFALKGAGDTRFVSLVVLLLPWPVMVLPTWLTAEWQGAIFWAWGAATVYSATIATIFYRRFRGGKWRAMRVVETERRLAS